MSLLVSLLAAVVVFIAGWAVIKRYPTVIVLFAAGLIMIGLAILFGADSILPKNAKTTGLIWFDAIDIIRLAAIKQVAGIGMIIMVAGGFAKYMETIGASGALVHACISPLKALHSPYIVLGLCYLVGAAMVPVVPSHGGMAMLLLTTMYPILLNLGVSKAGAAAAIFCSGTIGMGPGTGTALYAAKIADIEPIVYFVHYQLPVAIPMILVIAILNIFVQRYFDRRNDDVYEAYCFIMYLFKIWLFSNSIKYGNCTFIELGNRRHCRTDSGSKCKAGFPRCYGYDQRHGIIVLNDRGFDYCC